MQEALCAAYRKAGVRAAGMALCPRLLLRKEKKPNFASCEPHAEAVRERWFRVVLSSRRAKYPPPPSLARLPCNRDGSALPLALFLGLSYLRGWPRQPHVHSRGLVSQKVSDPRSLRPRPSPPPSPSDNSSRFAFSTVGSRTPRCVIVSGTKQAAVPRPARVLPDTSAPACVWQARPPFHEAPALPPRNTSPCPCAKEALPLRGTWAP